jgi:hypothetical protein
MTSIKGKRQEKDEKWEAFLASDREKRREYIAFCESIKNLEPISRAESWLEYISRNCDEFVENESLVYLRSRGSSCEVQIKNLIDSWKCSIERTSNDTNIHPGPPAFWGARDQQEIFIDATMLRTVEWCEIGGFDEYWENLARGIYSDSLKYGVENTEEAGYWLFYLCRSDYAIELMEKALRRNLESLQHVEDGTKFPWEHIHNERNEEDQIISHSFQNLVSAAVIIFITARLNNSFKNQDYVEDAGKLLIKTQLNDGSWPFFIEDGVMPKPGCVESTAIIIHALVLLKPKGWKIAVDKARDWLLNQQSDCGFWDDGGIHPNITYLTVLVMDALSIISGNTDNLTFSYPDIEDDKKSVKVPRKISNVHFKIGLSFPGEYRSLVHEIAEKLGKELGKDSIFYDKYYDAILSKPGIDADFLNIFSKNTELIVAFLCKEYDMKLWCGLEWRAIRELIRQKQDDRIMLLRLGDGEIACLLGLDGYLDISNMTADEIVSKILERYRFSFH